ncbi:hypothetical protein [Mycoplasma parvum]|uniref:Uncharacterized protein n=1 Tax=Mycoplasma parvum str. Indiana TaxID=1403316 RepID=U5NBQ9_9MOLU|nr:hypothetical protein [Mycoplasma parvum]AGX88996.1 hypothetical protein PRV_01170 [Mycoplasma parvum str. Indiana]
MSWGKWICYFGSVATLVPAIGGGLKSGTFAERVKRDVEQGNAVVVLEGKAEDQKDAVEIGDPLYISVTSSS